MSSPYDAFARFYDRYWAAPFQRWGMPALETLLLPDVPSGGSLLDLCCGTGNLAEHLVSLGYAVTGLDSSQEMLRVAREKVPDAVFLHADVGSFGLERRVDGVVSVFDSLNHLMEVSDLQLAFHNVYEALKPGGCFVFDGNTEEAYGERWDRVACAVEFDHAYFLRGRFDAQAGIGITQITMFELLNSWSRSDVEMRQRPWGVSETTLMLLEAGFREVKKYRANEDLGMTGHYGIGRVYFRAYK